MLFVAITLPPFTGIGAAGGTRVAELVIEDSEVVDDDVNAVEPDNWDDREL